MAKEQPALKKAKVTYVAPPGDAKVTEAFGHTYFDGKAEEVELDAHALGKLSNNPCFKVDAGNGAGKADTSKEDTKAKK